MLCRRSNLFTPSGKGKGEEKRPGEVGSGRSIPVRQGILYKKSNKSFSKVQYTVYRTNAALFFVGTPPPPRQTPFFAAKFL